MSEVDGIPVVLTEAQIETLSEALWAARDARGDRDDWVALEKYLQRALREIRAEHQRGGPGPFCVITDEANLGRGANAATEESPPQQHARPSVEDIAYRVAMLISRAWVRGDDGRWRRSIPGSPPMSLDEAWATRNTEGGEEHTTPHGTPRPIAGESGPFVVHSRG